MNGLLAFGFTYITNSPIYPWQALFIFVGGALLSVRSKLGLTNQVSPCVSVLPYSSSSLTRPCERRWAVPTIPPRR